MGEYGNNSGTVFITSRMLSDLSKGQLVCMKAAGMLVSRLRMVCLTVLTIPLRGPWVTPDHLNADTCTHKKEGQLKTKAKKGCRPSQGTQLKATRRCDKDKDKVI